MMALFFRRAWAFLRKDWLTEASYRLAYFFQAVGMLYPLFIFFFLGQMFADRDIPQLGVYGGEYFPFILVGLAATNMTAVAMRSLAGRIQQAQVTGTLEALLIAQVPMSQLAVHLSIYDLVTASARVIFTLIFGALFFKVSFANANYFAAAVFFVVSLFAFGAMGILSAAFLIVFKRGDPLSSLIGIFSSLLGGVYFPTSMFPGWVQKVSLLLPLTHALEGLRMTLLRGAGLREVSAALLGLGMFILVVAPFSLWAFRKAIRVARQEGTLNQY